MLPRYRELGYFHDPIGSTHFYRNEILTPKEPLGLPAKTSAKV
jgi:hypothetical protein